MRFKTIGILIFTLACLSSTARATVILELQPSGNIFPCGSCFGEGGWTLGYAFDVIETISVDGLGIFDVYSDGIGTTVETGLWIDAGALLASVTVSDASTPEGSPGNGHWLFEDIAPLVLTAGRYVLGSTSFQDEPLAQTSQFTTIPEISLVEARQDFSSGLIRPDLNIFGVTGIGPTLRLTETSEVPVPSTLALSLISLIYLWNSSRRRVSGLTYAG